MIRDTKVHARLEGSQVKKTTVGEGVHKPKTFWVFAETSWRNKTLFSVSQAGLVNNLNDGMSWGVFPLLFASAGVGLEGIGWIKAIYPVVWGLGMIVTGPLADRIGRKPLIVWGMFIQAIGHLVIGLGESWPFESGIIGSVLLGLGTAMVYPALLAAVSDAAHPSWRASSVGVYRFWRDIGYAVGALMSGIIASFLGLEWAVHAAGLLTFLSGLLVLFKMKETLNFKIDTIKH